MRIVGAVLVALACAGCQQQEEVAAANVAAPAPTPRATPVATATEPAEAVAPLLNLAPDGLTLVDAKSGSARHITFGTPQFEATQSVDTALGNFTGQAENPECGAGPLTSFDYTGGLTLYFQNKRFAGWELDGEGGLTTANGIGIGMTRAALEKAGSVVAMAAESSIGHEFTAGDLSGLLSDLGATGRVTSLWAGTTCIFR